jgi:serine/threonine protein kinase
VAKCRHYDCSADVFSFGILLWEILSLKKAFGGNMTHKDYHNRVSIFGERPPVNNRWPPLTREMMREAWAENPKKRPSFKRVAILIRADLSDLSHDNEVVNRTNHMMRRSIRSLHGTRTHGSSTTDIRNEIHDGFILDEEC